LAAPAKYKVNATAPSGVFASAALGTWLDSLVVWELAVAAAGDALAVVGLLDTLAVVLGGSVFGVVQAPSSATAPRATAAA
jgi:hypothetical protein